MNKVSIFPIMNLPEFDTGHEIVEELIKSLEENKISLEDTDVIVITQKKWGIKNIFVTLMLLLSKISS